MSLGNMKKQNLAIIGASYLQLPLIEKAKELGYTTHVFAWAANDVGEKAADYFYPISITEVEQITEKCKQIGICGICSIATDLGNIAVNYVADKLGLPCNSPESTKKSTNKHLMRLAFEKNGDPSPKSIQVDEKTDLSELELTYPIIVKPTDRSGSRGIYKLETKDGLENAVRAALSEGFEKKALIEEFAEGQEYSVEGISYNGEHHILAMTLKYTTGAPHFIETGHMEPAPVSDEMYKKVVQVVKHALDTLEIKNSASHSELKIDKNGNIRIIEIGARMGGDCIGSDLVKYSTGIDYLKAVIDVACGNAPDLNISGEICSPEVRFILTKEDLDEFNRIKAEEPDKLLKIVDEKHLTLIGKTTDSSNRAGCYIIRK
ncbi:MAG: ATP-grasp domain-containing protein [Spirochaetia bacterium]|nr:ATP-grasp domain-containing protein [Spirochaetia bacterium]